MKSKIIIRVILQEMNINMGVDEFIAYKRKEGNTPLARQVSALMIEKFAIDEHGSESAIENFLNRKHSFFFHSRKTIANELKYSVVFRKKYDEIYLKCKKMLYLERYKLLEQIEKALPSYQKRSKKYYHAMYLIEKLNK